MKWIAPMPYIGWPDGYKLFMFELTRYESLLYVLSVYTKEKCSFAYRLKGRGCQIVIVPEFEPLKELC